MLIRTLYAMQERNLIMSYLYHDSSLDNILFPLLTVILHNINLRTLLLVRNENECWCLYSLKK